MTVAPGRVICPKCGANNFETQAACWKCGSPLVPGNLSATPDVAAPRGGVPGSVARVVDNVDPSVAHWVGVIGGLLVPFAMLPVGFIFLMWDERRKVEVGRTATIASLVGTALHMVVTWFAVYGTIQTVVKMFPSMSGRPGAAQVESTSDPNASVKPLELPGIPPAVPAK